MRTHRHSQGRGSRVSWKSEHVCYEISVCLKCVRQLKTWAVWSTLKMDWDCETGVTETLPAASCLLEGNGDVGGTKTRVGHDVFFSVAPRRGEWKISSRPRSHETLRQEGAGFRVVCEGISADWFLKANDSASARLSWFWPDLMVLSRNQYTLKRRKNNLA